MFSFGETTMRPIRNFMTKEEIQEDIESMTVKDKIESPAELEYQAQQYWDEREYDVCLDLISRASNLTLLIFLTLNEHNVSIIYMNIT